MRDKRQKSLWDLLAEGEGEARRAEQRETEASTANPDTESPAATCQLMEEIVSGENMRRALKRVRSNKGSAGVDGMTVEALVPHLVEHWPRYREQLLAGTYRPQPVKQVLIPKPDGGQRMLGVPTVMDRLIQQAVLQVLQPQWDPTFSEHSYGFRPGRSAHQAVAAAQQIIAEGHGWVVDIDLEKFFDRVNHDILMSRVARRVSDKRVLKLIRGFLTAGMLVDGLVGPREEGTPQGGPLSPLLSNLLLDEWDKELEARGHRFVRYADDNNIYVRSERAGQRVLASVTEWLSRRLRLKVNASKSGVARPNASKFLGFSFTGGKEPKRRIAPKALKRLKGRVRELTRRTRGVSLDRMVGDLRGYLVGWRSYFGYCQTPSVLEDQDKWIRRRLRCFQWKQWKRGRTRYKELRARGLGCDLAATTAGSAKSHWRVSASLGLNLALPNAYLASLGLPTLAPSR